MKNILVVFCAVIVISGLLLAQETPPPPGTGSAQQPVPPAGQQPTTPAPSTGQPQPTPAPATAQQAPTSTPAQPGSTPASAAKKTQIAPGSVIPVQLTKTVDAKKAKKGDEVVAKVTQDLQASSGQVIVPKDTKVVGHVTEVQPRSKEQKESQLAITFDRMDIKGGEQMPMSIQAIIAPPNRNANDNNAAPSNQPSGSPSGGYSGANASPGGRGATSVNSGNPPSVPSTPENAGSGSSEPQNSAGARPPITGETRGVVGISNLTLSAAPDATQGSVVTSDKNNVKLEDGTLMLLRVNPEGGQSPATSPTPQNPQK